MHKSYFLTAGLLSVALLTQAQSTTPANRVEQRILAADSIPTMITFKSTKAYKDTEAAKALREQLQLPQDEQMVKTTSEVDDLGFVHSRYQLYYRGIKVESATYSVHARSGAVESISGHLKHSKQLAVVPTLTASAALKRATDFVGATQYMWQAPQEEAGLKRRENKSDASYLPQGELVIVANSLSTTPAKQGKLTLAWKFDVFARQPLSRAYIYVDAQTGEIVAQDAIMKSILGTFDTRYSGTRNLDTDVNPSGGFRLRDYTRANGIETLNSFGTSTIAGAVDFVDNDNKWTAAEYNNSNFDNAAGDAHFGAQSTFDYWKNVHNRNSYDNKGTRIRGYVHYNPTTRSSWDNARWTGSEMVYGDGTAAVQPLTSLDVCAHEIGHGVCASTANLAYKTESGALNEGFSDIWGACVEQYAMARLGLTKATWIIGEDIDSFGAGFRSMSDPRSLGQPAYYRGRNWVADPGSYNDGNDYGGVHTNSGVLNHWFFVLSQGESGTNEGNMTYSVTGIGINSAARIAYRAESIYMTADNSYADARTHTIQAARDLFGPESCEVAAVIGAWYAVGVGTAPLVYITSGPNQVCAGTTATYTATNGAGVTWRAEPANLFTNTSGSGSQFSTSAVSGAQGTGTITLTYCGGSSDVKSVKVGPGEPTGYYNLNSSGGTLQTVQFVSPGDVTLFLNEPFTFTFSASPSSVYLNNTVGRSTSFRLNANQSVQINVTSSQPDCGLAGRFVFSTSGGYGYRLAPNPASDELTVTANDPANPSADSPASPGEPFDADLYDTYGKKVKTKKSDHGQAVLDVRSLPEGLYNLRVGTGKDAYSEHIQVTH